MLILDGTAESLRVRLTSAHTTAPLRCVASYRGVDTTTFTPANSLVSTNGTTPVEIVAAPGASAQRVIDFVSIFNNDTVNQTVIVSVWDGSTHFDIARITLGPNERLEYSEGQGFCTYNAAGALKTIATGTQNQLSSGWSTSVLASDVINNNAVANTIADITGLSFPVVSGSRYWFRFWIWWTSAVNTTGARFSISGPTQNALAYRSDYSLTATTRTINEAIAYDIPAAANASPANTAGSLALIEGYIQPTADGNVIGRFASEIANSAVTAKAGSFVEFIAVA